MTWKKERKGCQHTIISHRYGEDEIVHLARLALFELHKEVVFICDKSKLCGFFLSLREQKLVLLNLTTTDS